jgi:hypothetical protein
MPIEEIAEIRYRLHLSRWAPLCDNTLILDNLNGIAGQTASKNSRRIGNVVNCSKCVTPVFRPSIIRKVFLETTDWVCPQFVYRIEIADCRGAGGGGGGIDQFSGSASGGGGGGAHSRKFNIPTIPGEIYRMNVGLKGNKGHSEETVGASSGTTDGEPGGDTWAVEPTIVLAKGGSGSQRAFLDDDELGGEGGKANLGIGDVRWNGGRGADGFSVNYGGGGGASASIDEDGVSATNRLGAIATSDGSNGADGGEDAVDGGGGGGGGKGGEGYLTQRRYFIRRRRR